MDLAGSLNFLYLFIQLHSITINDSIFVPSQNFCGGMKKTTLNPNQNSQLLGKDLKLGLNISAHPQA
jgi:hypothetical protein